MSVFDHSAGFCQVSQWAGDDRDERDLCLSGLRRSKFQIFSGVKGALYALCSCEWHPRKTSTSRLASTCQCTTSLLQQRRRLRLLPQSYLAVGRTLMQRPPQVTAVATRGSAWLGPMAAAGLVRRVDRFIACRTWQRNNGLSTLRMASTVMCSAAWATALKPRRSLCEACRQLGLSDRSGPRSTTLESGARWCARGCTTSRAAATWHSRREARRSSSWRRCKVAPSVPRVASRCS